MITFSVAVAIYVCKCKVTRIVTRYLSGQPIALSDLNGLGKILEHHLMMLYVARRDKCADGEPPAVLIVTREGANLGINIYTDQPEDYT